MPQLDKYCLMTLMTLTTVLCFLIHFIFVGVARKLQRTIVIREKLAEFNKKFNEIQQRGEERAKITDKYFADRYTHLKEQMDRSEFVKQRPVKNKTNEEKNS